MTLLTSTGNRRGRGRTYVNLLLTMLLGGLWHGAGWNFLAWGGLHGLLLIAHRLFGSGRTDENAPLSLRDAPRIFLLFQAVCLFWIFFRAPSLDHALVFLTPLFTQSYAAHWPLLPSAVVVLCFGLHLAERWLRLNLPSLQSAAAERRWGAPAEGLAFGTLAALVLAASGVGGGSSSTFNSRKDQRVLRSPHFEQLWYNTAPFGRIEARGTLLSPRDSTECSLSGPRTVPIPLIRVRLHLNH